ncbi:MAG: L,D-transpeptidase family protein [Alphaproteobacteria bacterium]|nr:L,D-transpeptidase family protein [Alphaproteobacteria bacterium]
MHLLLRCIALTALIFAAPAQKALAAYDLPYIGEMQEIRAEYEDTFVHLARDYNLGFVELRAANPYVDPWLPGKGTKLILPTQHILPDAPRSGVVINLADMRLYAYYDKSSPPFSTPVGVGREGLNTPLGTTTIVRKTEGPIWRPTDRMRREDPKLPAVVYPGDENPMGTHAMYLGWPQYAIHGTNKPFGIGRRSSSGCLRLYPEAITRVYEMFPVGTKVTVVNQPVKLAWIGDELFLEASPTIEQSVQMEEMGQVSEQKLTDAEMKKIIQIAGAFQDRLRWPTIRTAIKERKGYPVVIARKPSANVTGNTPAADSGAKKKETSAAAPDKHSRTLSNAAPDNSTGG